MSFVVTSIVEVSINKIKLWTVSCVDGWTNESAIIASNGGQLILVRSILDYTWFHPQKIPNLTVTLKSWHGCSYAAAVIAWLTARYFSSTPLSTTLVLYIWAAIGDIPRPPSRCFLYSPISSWNLLNDYSWLTPFEFLKVMYIWCRRVKQSDTKSLLFGRQKMPLIGIPTDLMLRSWINFDVNLTVIGSTFFVDCLLQIHLDPWKKFSIWHPAGNSVNSGCFSTFQ